MANQIGAITKLVNQSRKRSRTRIVKKIILQKLELYIIKKPNDFFTISMQSHRMQAQKRKPSN